MKVLLDTCVWGGALKHLETAGLDVVWTGSWPEDIGDEEMPIKSFKKISCVCLPALFMGTSTEICLRAL
ncbi:MAG: hypothetical protein M0036_24350 [Desulfobacteraceae bacterium]|nr:hypothetical protein [Desulfobacteraceae bacterium]